MPVLSDTTLRTRLAELVPLGAVSDATHCSYEFTAAKVFKGAAGSPIPVTSETPVVIEPTELVWILAKEEVSVPDNCVGLWVQTQTLSRKGLLLLNMTLVEPGYRGPLHAVFVNFGRSKVTIGPTTKIAKVIFMELDQPATDLVPCATPTYESSIMDISSNAPDSFMHLSSLVPDLQELATGQAVELQKKASELQGRIVEQAVADIRKEADKQKTDLTGDVKKAVLKFGGGALVGLVVGIAAVWLGLSVYLPTLTASYTGVEAIAQRAVQERAAAIESASDQLRTNRDELDKLRKELESLRQENMMMERRVRTVETGTTRR